MTSPYHRPLRVGTRGSPLALAQARQVTGQLRERCGRAAVLITMSTPGDGSAAPIELGRRLAQVLLQRGGAALLATTQGMGPASGAAGTAATVHGSRALAPDHGLTQAGRSHG